MFKTSKTLLARPLWCFIFLAGCNNAENTEEMRIFNLGTDFESAEERTLISDEICGDSTINENEWVCTRQTYDISKVPDEYPTFDPNAGIIWPGNLLQGASLKDATPRVINVARGPGKIVMDLNSGQQFASREVNISDFGNTKDAENFLVESAYDGGEGNFAANFSMTVSQVQSMEELALNMDANVKSLSSSFKTRIGFQRTDQKTRFLVSLKQSFYTMVFQTPTQIEDFFGAEVSPSDLDPYTGPGNPAAFISSVTYGRLFTLLIESSSSRSEMEAAISAEFKGGVYKGGGSANVKKINELNEINIKVFALGGDGEKTLGASYGNMEEVIDALAKAGDIRTGKPLSFVVRSVQTGQIVKVSAATKYDVVNCTPLNSAATPPAFTDFWAKDIDAVGAALGFGDDRLALFEKNGTKYWISDSGDRTMAGPYDIKDANTPFGVFPLDSVGAAQLFINGSMYFFNKPGNKWVVYRNGKFGGVNDVFTYGCGTNPLLPRSIGAGCLYSQNQKLAFLIDDTGEYYVGYDGSCNWGKKTPITGWNPKNIPFNAAGAAAYLRLGNRKLNIFFSKSGTEYSIFENHSTPFSRAYKLTGCSS